MPQRADSNRHASLDDKKLRAAGRQQNQNIKQIRDPKEEQFAKGKTGGAFGRTTPTARSESARNAPARGS